jgi:DNA mismatch repair ATPase MutL
MVNHVDFYKNNIDILLIEIKQWIKTKDSKLKNKLNHIIKTNFNKTLMLYLVEDLNYDWREFYIQPPSNYYNLKKIDKMVMFVNYKKISDEQLYICCLDDKKNKIPTKNIKSCVLSEIYKRYGSYVYFINKMKEVDNTWVQSYK